MLRISLEERKLRIRARARLSPTEREQLDRDYVNAAANGWRETVSHTLEEGANPDARNKEGVPALVLAVLNGGHIVTVKTIARAWANLDQTSPLDGNSAIMVTIPYFTGCFEKLAMRGASFDIRNNEGLTGHDLVRACSNPMIHQYYSYALETYGRPVFRPAARVAHPAFRR